jgi:protein-tyrosine phosphatase
MTFARTLLVLHVCSLAGCYRAQVEPKQRDEDRRRVTAGDHEPSSPHDAGLPTDATDVGMPAEPDAGRDLGAVDADPVIGDHVPRWILVDEVVNARDLGGVPLGSGRSVEHGAVFRGPPLTMLSPSGCAELERLGIRTVIDLRIESERSAVPEADCVERSARVILAPLPVPYDVSPLDYIADLDATDSIAMVFQRLGDAESYPVYVHCTWGRDRTGVLAAIILRALGASRANIMKEYLLSLATVGAYPDSLAAVLDTIERRGGIESYLSAAGVSADALATLRMRGVRSPEPPR